MKREAFAAYGNPLLMGGPVLFSRVGAGGGGPTTQGPFDATNWLDLPLGGTWIDIAAYASTFAWPTSPDNNVAYVMDFRVPPGPPNELGEYIFTFQQDGVFLGNSAFQVEQLPARRQVSFANPATSRLTITTNNGDVTLFDVAFPTFTEPSQEFPPGTLDAQVEAILAGTGGVAFDPRDLSTMWQDSAGTVPVTADGQAVGRIISRFGDAVQNFLQATAAARPVLDTGELVFDGVDDLMGFSDRAFFSGVPGGMWCARFTKVGLGAGTANRIIHASLSTNATTERFTFATTSTATGIQTVTRRPDAGTLVRNQSGVVAVDVPVTMTMVADWAGVGGTLDSWLDGVLLNRVNIPAPEQNSDAALSNTLRIGAGATQGGKIGRLIMTPFIPTPEERAIFEAWVAE